MSETSFHAGLDPVRIDSMRGVCTSVQAFVRPSPVADRKTVFTKRVWPGGRRPSH